MATTADVASAVEPTFLKDPTQDRLVDAVLALVAELWIERDRRLILERLLVERGVVSADEIEQYRPAPELDAERRRQREALVERIFGGLNTL